MKLLQKNNKNKGPFETEDAGRRVTKVSSTNVIGDTSSSCKLRADVSAPPIQQSLTLNPPESSERRRIPLVNKNIGPGSKLFVSQHPEVKTPKNRSKMKEMSLTHQNFTGVPQTQKNANEDTTFNLMSGAQSGFNSTRRGFKRGQAVDPN